MRTVIRFGALALLIATLIGTWWLRSTGAAATVAIRHGVEVSGGTREQLAMARWAVGRFETAGLEAPAVVIAFHRGLSGCGGHLGWALGGEVDLCSTLVNAMSRRALLHEMSHIWLDRYVGASLRERFLDLRDLTSWNASSDPWELRGYEQGAEIMAWVLGERILTPLIPFEDSGDLDVAFRLLTGVKSLIVQPAVVDGTATTSRTEVNHVGVPPVIPSSAGGGEMAVPLSLAIGTAVAAVGWLLVRLAGGRSDRSSRTRRWTWLPLSRSSGDELSARALGRRHRTSPRAFVSDAPGMTAGEEIGSAS